TTGASRVVHNAEAESGPRDVSDFFGRGKSGSGDDADELLFGKLRGRLIDETELLRAWKHLFLIDAAAVAGNPDKNRRPVAFGSKRQCCHRLLTSSFALGGGLDSV